eukprot:6201642-Pleurochrysis_carterae.AAC.3
MDAATAAAAPTPELLAANRAKLRGMQRTLQENSSEYTSTSSMKLSEARLCRKTRLFANIRPAQTVD